MEPLSTQRTRSRTVAAPYAARARRTYAARHTRATRDAAESSLTRSRRLRCAPPRPGVSAGSALAARRRTPGQHTQQDHLISQLIRPQVAVRQSVSSLPIVRLATIASRAALRAVACDRLRRP